MNYIKNLEGSNLEKDIRLNRTINRLHELRAFIVSDKFTGIDQSGDSKDWISTKDVDRFLVEMIAIAGIPIEWGFNEAGEMVTNYGPLLQEYQESVQR